MDTVEKYLGRRIIFHLFLIALFVWVAESLVHVLIFSEHSLLDTLHPFTSPHELYMRILLLATCFMLYLLFIKNRVIREKEKQIENILDNVIPVCITNTDYEVVMANDSYWNIWGKPESGTVKCYDHRPGTICHTDECALKQVLNGVEVYEFESRKHYNGHTSYFIVTARPFLDTENRIIGVIESFQDITERIRLENEKTDLINQLQASLEHVKFLSGLLPICASCKKIRDDKGYWNQIESYIRDHSDAEFSHSICPDCARKLYPDFVDDE